MSRSKLLTLEAMQTEREKLRASSLRLVFTNGCFDLLHPGHVRYLAEARTLGDRLVVAVNADRTVAALKGKGRPILPLEERMEILGALECVDYVVAFQEETPARVIQELVPDVLVKGGDWSTDQIVGRDTVESAGGQVLSLPFTSGYSTSKLIERVLNRVDKREDQR
jgi:D-beta-D-heptose 7-phosphate kinase/D-beta-D-heptose 1-phosphate adenosyltransferase